MWLADHVVPVVTLTVLTVLATLAGFFVVGQQARWSDEAAAEGRLPGHAITPSDAPAPVSALFIGDSYSAGTGASPKSTKRWTTLVAAHEGWEEDNVAYGGTGYLVSTGAQGSTSTNTSCGLNFCPNYGEVLQAAAGGRATPSVIVVSGGRNDVASKSSQSSIDAAVDAFFVDLRKDFPKATVYVTSPIWDSTSPPSGLAVEAQRIQADATRAKCVYLDLRNPLQGHPDDIIADGVHPNNTGHALIASTVEAAIKQAPSVPQG